jgi:hypothetical protein
MRAFFSHPISNHELPISQSKALPLEGGNPRAAHGMGFRAPLNFLEAPLSLDPSRNPKNQSRNTRKMGGETDWQAH